MKKLKLLIVLTTILFMPQVNAKEINHFYSEYNDTILAQDTYNGTAALAGDNITLDGDVNGIAFVAGNKVTLNGTADYTVLAGNSININGTIENDSIIAGNIITTTDEATFQRDVIIVGSDIELSGTFSRNVSIYGSNITIKNASIKGDTHIYAESLSIISSNIEGNLTYPEDCIISIDSSNITSEEKTDAISTTDETYLSTISSKIWSFLCMSLIFAAICLFIPNAFNKINDKYEKAELSEIIEVFTKGLVVLILVPVISILLFCTVLGIPLGVILLILYGLAIYLSTIFTSYLIGYKIWQKFFDKDVHILFIGLIGLAIIMLLELIPGLRYLVSIIVMLVGLGLIFDTVRKD